MTDFDPMRGPGAVAIGTAGTLRIAGLRAGVVTSWRMVHSPTARHEDGTPYLVLFAEGRFARFFQAGARARLELIPSAPKARIGRPRPPVPKPFALEGRLVEYSASRLTLADGDIARG